MSELPFLAAPYAIFLAGSAALISRASEARGSATQWTHAQLARFRGGIACTLFVLSGFVLILAAAWQHDEPGAIEWLAASAVVVGAIAIRTITRAPETFPSLLKPNRCKEHSAQPSDAAANVRRSAHDVP